MSRSRRWRAAATAPAGPRLSQQPAGLAVPAPGRQWSPRHSRSRACFGGIPPQVNRPCLAPAPAHLAPSRSGAFALPSIAALALLAFPLICLAEAPAAPATEPPPSPWDFTALATVGAGYRDNVLRTSIQPEGSGFAQLTADASLSYLTERGTFLNLLLLGDEVRYFNAPEVDREQLFAASLDGGLGLGSSAEWLAHAGYVYQYQIVDASADEVAQQRVLVEGQEAQFWPAARLGLGGGWLLRLSVPVRRQLYQTDLDDYWEFGGKVELARRYGHRSEFACLWEWRERPYDTREQYDVTGMPLFGTALTYTQQELGGAWKHHWDEARRWRTTLKLTGLLNRDDGSGYFDYDRVQFSAQARWKAERWELTGRVGTGWYHYPVQRVGGELRQRAYVTLDLRVERRLGRHWLVYAAAAREWNTSNDPLDEYTDWVASAGVGYEF